MDQKDFGTFTVMLRGSLLMITAWIARHQAKPITADTNFDWLEFLDVMRRSLLEITTWIERHKARSKSTPTSTPPLPSMPAMIMQPPLPRVGEWMHAPRSNS